MLGFAFGTWQGRPSSSMERRRSWVVCWKGVRVLGVYALYLPGPECHGLSSGGIDIGTGFLQGLLHEMEAKSA